ncbi:MAG: succinate dehydrogenase cytochrome b subunit [Actinomycetaceae bacterium]|nr:succinate dehydrogenase cytochrome b subunit [Actinomycetaceae bacterium]
MANTTLKSKNRAKSTTVAIKQAMSLSGLFFVLFLIIHSYGNLKMFYGLEMYNGYALHLRTFLMPILPYEGLLWILRVVLIVLIVVHVVAALYLWLRAGKARGSRYVVKSNLATAYAARTVRWGGIILGAFIVFHLAHFTMKYIKPGADVGAYDSHTIYLNDAGHVVDQANAVLAVPEGNAYAMMITTFSEWYMVLLYGVAMLALCLHIAHGVWSGLQTMGWLRRSTMPWVTVISGLVGLGVFALFMLPPFGILLGLIQ